MAMRSSSRTPKSLDIGTWNHLAVGLCLCTETNQHSSEAVFFFAQKIVINTRAPIPRRPGIYILRSDDVGGGNGTGTNLTSGGGSKRVAATITTGDRGTSGGAGRLFAAAGGGAGSTVTKTLASVGGTTLGGVARISTTAADFAVRRKGCALGARSDAGAGTKKTAKKSRSQSRATTSAIAPTSLGTKDDIQQMVDTIKSRNLNNGGGRQAKGGPWIREHNSFCFPVEKNV